MCLSNEFWLSKVCWKGGKKSLSRDKIEVIDNQVCYVLWGNVIAVWDKVQNTLKITDCGWRSALTFKRLNALLSALAFSIRSIRCVTFLSILPQNVEYKWAGTHTINLTTHEVTPATPRKTNPKAAQTLRNYYATAIKLVNTCKQLTVHTVTDETVCLFPKMYNGRYFSLPVLGLYVNGDTLKAYVGYVSSSKVYSAFMKNNAIPVVNHLAQVGRELCGQSILVAIKDYHIDVGQLPENIGQQLALIRLLED